MRKAAGVIFPETNEQTELSPQPFPDHLQSLPLAANGGRSRFQWKIQVPSPLPSGSNDIGKLKPWDLQVLFENVLTTHFSLWTKM